MKFRKKPVVIEAMQWTGDNEAELVAFVGGQHFRTVHPDDRGDDADWTAEVFDVLHSTWVRLYTMQWVIQGVQGEFYPIAPAVLAATYEAVES